MSPIRIGIIGLSQGAWAANAHLPYLQNPESKFEIVAVCNSSVESAAKSVRDLNLKGSVKTYGNAQGMSMSMIGLSLLRYNRLPLGRVHVSGLTNA
jgi:predicted dehydrogenase